MATQELEFAIDDTPPPAGQRCEAARDGTGHCPQLADFHAGPWWWCTDCYVRYLLAGGVL